MYETASRLRLGKKLRRGDAFFCSAAPCAYINIYTIFFFLKARLCGVARNEVASKKASSMFYLIHSYLITN
jgi:hypothetical protein